MEITEHMGQMARNQARGDMAKTGLRKKEIGRGGKHPQGGEAKVHLAFENKKIPILLRRYLDRKSKAIFSGEEN
jgi:hypothetical protein